MPTRIRPVAATGLLVTALALAGCSDGGGAAASGRASKAAPETIEFRGYKFPKTIGHFTAPDCLPELAAKQVQAGQSPSLVPQPAGQTKLSDSQIVNSTLRVAYLETGLTPQMEPRPMEIMCARIESNRADAIMSSAVLYSSPEAAQAALKRQMPILLGTDAKQIGQSQCNGLDPEWWCLRVRDSTIYMSYPQDVDKSCGLDTTNRNLQCNGMPQSKSLYTGWHVVTMEDVALINDAVADAQ